MANPLYRDVSSSAVTTLSAPTVRQRTEPVNFLLDDASMQELLARVNGLIAFSRDVSAGTFTFSGGVDIPLGTTYRINGTVVLSATALGSSVTMNASNITSGTLSADRISTGSLAYSKLSLANTIVNADISTSAAIAVSKLAASTISGITLGNNLTAVTFKNDGTGAASGTTYNGSSAITVSHNTLGALSLGGGILTGTVTSATGMTAWSTTTQGTSAGNMHIGVASGTASSGGAITFVARDSGTANTAQAGIYVISDGSFGTKMYLSTTDSYAAGSKTAVSIDHAGIVNFPRARPTYNGNTILDAANYNSYAPTLTGTGASGSSWNISILGNAATVTNGMYLSGNQDLSGVKAFYTPNGQTYNLAAGNIGLTVYNNTAGADAMMTFHVANDWAGYFGVGGAENDLVWTGWSVGNNRYRILHTGNYSNYALPLTGGTLTGDITTYRAGSPTTGVIYLGNSGTRYLYYDGTNYNLNAANLNVNSLRAGTWTGSASYRGIYHSGMTGSEYIIMSGDSDTNTYISARTGSSVHIRGGNNVSTYAIIVSPTARATSAGFTILDAGNYNSYAPTLTGTGASGNWNINAVNITAYTINQSVGTGNTPTFVNAVLRGTSPTLYLRDTDNRSSMIHCNSNLWYVLRGSGNDSDTWAQVNGEWPLYLNLENNDARFGGAIVAAGAKSFRIRHPHPELNETHDLLHFATEGPRADLIYRGRAELINGIARISIDAASHMRQGTLVLLAKDFDVFAQMTTGWTLVRGYVDTEGYLNLEAQTPVNGIVTWLVIGQRQDSGVHANLDTEGNYVTEVLQFHPDPGIPCVEE